MICNVENVWQILALYKLVLLLLVLVKPRLNQGRLAFTPPPVEYPFLGHSRPRFQLRSSESSSKTQNSLVLIAYPPDIRHPPPWLSTGNTIGPMVNKNKMASALELGCAEDIDTIDF